MAYESLGAPWTLGKLDKSFFVCKVEILLELGGFLIGM